MIISLINHSSIINDAEVQQVLRGDAVLYLGDCADSHAALGWHQANYRDIAYLNLFDPRSGKWEQTVFRNDAAAQFLRRLRGKTKAGRGYRRSHPRQF